MQISDNFQALVPIKWATEYDLKTKRGIIYIIVNIITGKRYIGKTINTFYERYRRGEWIINKSKENYFLKKDIEIYGKNSFKVQIILENCLNEYSLAQSEIFFANHYGSYYPNGYNIDKCGHSSKKRAKPHLFRNGKEEIVEIFYTRKFCHQNKLDRKCLLKLIKGKIFFYRDLHLPFLTLSECKRLGRNYRKQLRFICDRYNNIYLVKNTALFEINHGLKRGAVGQILTGSRIQFNGWHLPKTDLSRKRKSSPI